MPKVQPKKQQLPPKLRPYVFHGLDLNYREGSKQVEADCPFCGRAGKFSVNVEDGLYQCFVCREGTEKGGGNIYVFLRKLWEYSSKHTKDYTTLATNRKLLDPNTLKSWGVVRSMITNDWLIPGYGIKGELNQLYRYLKDRESGRLKLYPTPELHHQLHGANLYDPRKPNLNILEGPWDGMALWETLRQASPNGKGNVLTNNDATSLLATTNVLAIPGCGSVGEPFKHWLPLMAGKNVRLFFDNDHPRKHPVTGAAVAPAGYEAVKRAVTLLSQAEEPPKSVTYLKWGNDGYDLTKPSGYDVRDFLGEAPTSIIRVNIVNNLLQKLAPVPTDWVPGRNGTSKAGNVSMDCEACDNWNKLVNSWRKAMKWIEGLDRALSVMLASIASTKAVGDQLWVKIISPASAGKSTLCEAVSINKKYVLAKSTIRGFHSGFKTDRTGADDHSLISQLYDKTLVTKDGDTLLQSPNLSQILSEGRDLYDSTSRTHYRHGLSRDYQGVRMTWILCGTSSLRSIDSSELGERFLDCVIMEAIDDDLEDEILLRVAHKVDRNMSMESGKELNTQNDPDLTKAMRLTGGYIDYLRDNAPTLLSEVVVNQEQMHMIIKLGKFVAYMRARPSKLHDEHGERELASRLVSQHMRLAKCLAVVLNVKTVDEEVLRRVKRVAMDTSRGTTMELVKHLHRAGEIGIEVGKLATLSNLTNTKTRELLRFLRQIGVVLPFNSQVISAVNTRVHWKLTERLHKLYEEVMNDGSSTTN